MNALKVTRKELREMFRDRRVRVAFMMPVLIVFLMIQLFGFIESATSKASHQTFYVVKSDSPIVSVLSKGGFTIKQIDSVAQGEDMIRKGKAGVVLEFGKMPTVKGGHQEITAYFDPQQDTSQFAVLAIDRTLQEANKVALQQTLKMYGIPETAAEPLHLTKHEVKVGSQGAGQVIVSLLPYLIVLFAFTGGAALSSDLVAGEKEKNTLETLLISPVSRTEIVFGKFLALATVCLGGSVMAMLGLFFASSSQAGSKSEMFKGGFGITPTSGATILLLMIPLVAFFASILIAISSYAKNSREAQTYLALVNIFVIMPAVFSQVIGFTDLGSKIWINFIPILSTANNIRNALLGRTDPVAVAITVGMSLLIAGLAIRTAIWLFNREEVLTRV